MRIGSGTQYGSVHPSATPIAAAPPKHDAEQDRHAGGTGSGGALLDDLWCAETAHDDDAVERPDRDDDAVDHGVPRRRQQG